MTIIKNKGQTRMKLITIHGQEGVFSAILLSHIRDDTWLALSTKGKKAEVFQCDEGWGEVIENNTGQYFWFKELPHRDNDLPAVIYANGSKEWHQHGKLHRDNDLPAVIFADGTKFWYQHGKRHRDNDLPATIWANGTKFWYQHGKCHRDNDLPAVIYAGGKKYWYQHGKNIGFNGK